MPGTIPPSSPTPLYSPTLARTPPRPAREPGPLRHWPILSRDGRGWWWRHVADAHRSPRAPGRGSCGTSRNLTAKPTLAPRGRLRASGPTSSSYPPSRAKTRLQRQVISFPYEKPAPLRSRARLRLFVYQPHSEHFAPPVQSTRPLSCKQESSTFFTLRTPDKKTLPPCPARR